MEIINTKNKHLCGLSITAASLLIIGGIALCGYMLGELPHYSGLTVGEFILNEVIAILPIIAGGLWLRRLYLRRDKTTWRNGTIGSILFGIILVTAGILLLLLNSETGFHTIKPIIISWQMLVILIGVLNLCKPEPASGLILLSVGTFFLLPRISKFLPDTLTINPEFISNYWPALIAIAGIAFMVNIIFRRTCSSYASHCHRDGDSRKCDCRNKYYNKTEKVTNRATGTVNYEVVFGGSEQVFLEPVFNGGKISVVFGGVGLDLRRTSLPEGVTFLEVDAVFGGVEIKAPESWSIEIRSSSVFGGFSDKRRYYNDPENDGRKLVIIGECVFGGGEVA